MSRRHTAEGFVDQSLFHGPIQGGRKTVLLPRRAEGILSDMYITIGVTNGRCVRCGGHLYVNSNGKDKIRACQLCGYEG